MGGIKGRRYYEKFKRGEKLTLGQSVKAQHYVCNGEEEGGEDCKGKSCPLYQFMPYRKGKILKPKRQATQVELNNLQKAREKAKLVK